MANYMHPKTPTSEAFLSRFNIEYLHGAIVNRGRGKTAVYEFAESARFSERKCGPEGRLFESSEKSRQVSVRKYGGYF
jgi:hypothetical protein